MCGCLKDHKINIGDFMKNKKGFTLLELLVVVLIIGILAAIALPQYKEAVEKSIMQEAIINLKAIAEANERFYMLNGKYAGSGEIDKLDVEIPGEIKNNSQTNLWGNRIMTKYFIYAPNTGSNIAKAIAHRVKEGETDYQNNAPYHLRIHQSDNLLHCYTDNPSSIQRKLCTRLNQTGHL